MVVGGGDKLASAAEEAVQVSQSEIGYLFQSVSALCEGAPPKH